GAGGEQRRVLEQPDAFLCRAVADGGGPWLHDRERLRIRHRSLAHAPFDVGGHFRHTLRWRVPLPSAMMLSIRTLKTKGAAWLKCRSLVRGTKHEPYWRATASCWHLSLSRFSSCPELS